MSTTLTNGLKLPDKGSVDWYSDMQNNYTILDGAVGTIAEHTTALAGKAPAVHTHTKSDITDFPAYGNAAGTICEGNDSRLSDARTPVAHTHTKSDVTDLLNSNFIPSANNSYDLGSSSYQFKNTYTKGLYVDGNQVDPTLFPFMLETMSSGGLFPYYKLNVEKGFNDLTDTGIYRPRTDPTVPNTPDTGTIDGILVVFNAGSAASISTNRRCRQIYYTFNTNPRTFTRYGILSNTTGNWTWQDWVEVPTNNRSYKWNGALYLLGTYLGNEYTSNYYTNLGIYGKRDTYGQSGMFITKYRPAVNQGEMTTSDVAQLGIDALENSVRTNNVLDIKARGFDSETGKFTVCDVVTSLEGNLGTTDNPWKTLNGINPGALSLPDYSRSITIDTTNWHKHGNKILYTPTVSGWLQIVIPNDTDANNEKNNCIAILDSGTNPISGLAMGNSNNIRIYLSYPVIADRVYWIYIKSYSDTIITARLVQCQGNV